MYNTLVHIAIVIVFMYAYTTLANKMQIDGYARDVLNIIMYTLGAFFIIYALFYPVY